MKKISKKALKKSFFSSFARLIGVVLGASAGSLLTRTFGNFSQREGLAFTMALMGFILIWFAEYEREVGDDE